MSSDIQWSPCSITSVCLIFVGPSEGKHDPVHQTYMGMHASQGNKHYFTSSNPLPWYVKTYIWAYFLTIYPYSEIYLPHILKACLTFYLTHIFWTCNFWHSIWNMLTFYLIWIWTILHSRWQISDFLTYSLTYISTFFLALYLTYMLPVFLAFYLNFYLTVYLAYILTVYLAQILAVYMIYIRTYYLAFWHTCRHSIWHSMWHCSWRSIWHIFCHVVWHMILTFLQRQGLATLTWQEGNQPAFFFTMVSKVHFTWNAKSKPEVLPYQVCHTNWGN